jgi:high frequency lysogenization protein
MKHSKRDHALALAGVFQAATLVKQIATSGMANSAVIESSLETLFKFDADSVEDVYGGIAGVGAGIRELNRQLSSTRGERDMEITRYVISILTLEKKLSANKAMLEQIAKTLENIKSGLDYFSLMHENTILKIGQLYKDTISTLNPRIIVNGEQTHLANENNASRIRALLLAGLRSAILWRQCGGSRLSILFNRKSYETESKLLLRELK